MLGISFSHYSGCGNTFLIVNNLKNAFSAVSPELIPRLCRHASISSVDGLILLDPSAVADFSMRTFNADGTEAEMCGNGIRCLIHFIRKEGFNISQASIQTKERLLHAQVEGKEISIEMGAPTHWKPYISLSHDGTLFTLHSINTGVPHAVIFVDSLEDYPVVSLGQYFRNHPLFLPKGTNVNFAMRASQKSPYDMRLRTYERGVENETQACGTGATATALVAARVYGLTSPIRIQVASLDTLTISFEDTGNAFNKVKMKGSVQWICDGVF